MENDERSNKARSVQPFGNHLFAVDNVLSQARCAELIAQSESIGYIPATLSGQRKQIKNAHVRNNDRVIHDDPELASELWMLVKDYLPSQHFMWVPFGLNERFRFYRYDPGQRFVWHMDASFKRNEKESSKVTLLFYLNDVEEGGATSFKGFRVEPKAGKALFFLHKYLHQGEPVAKGRKYVLRTDVMYRSDPQLANKIRSRPDSAANR